ncbi:MAG: class I SAM-dependent methyltransferase [Opitutales bacterium]
MNKVESIDILSSNWNDYELLDSGNRLKLERFGDVIVIRSEPKAWWTPSLPNSEWNKAQAKHFDEDKNNTRWQFKSKINAPRLNYNGIVFGTKFMDGSKHLGVFPEQEPHWQKIANAYREGATLLNLFGYTGAATLVAAKAGYQVTHVDASKPSIDWARQNQALSNLEDKPIRWILDDALKFVKRQERRGQTYDAIILDPPAFGRGPKKELWKLDKMLAELLEATSNILSKNPLFVIMTMYSIEASSVMAKNMLEQYFLLASEFEAGELVLNSQNSKQLPLSLYAVAKWNKK